MDGKNTPSEEPTWQFKPGETISPRSEPSSPAPAAEKQVPVPAAATEPIPTPRPEPTPPPAVAATTPADQSTPAAPATAEYAATDGLSWTASEFIAHDKSASWHMGLIAVAVLAAVVLWFITRDVVTSVVIIVAGGVISLYGARRPGEIEYRLDNQGIGIGPKQYDFSQFRAFSVVPEGAFASIALLPIKRFAPMTTLYFDPSDGDRIIGILGGHLPEQPMKADAIDSLMRKIRF